MKVIQHGVEQFAEAIKSLLPPGAAWNWSPGGFGDTLLQGAAQELARVESSTQLVLDRAIETHRPTNADWHISAYRRVAAEAVADVVEAPRRVFSVGSRVGDRCWSAAMATFPVDLVRVDHLLGPLRVGSRVGAGCWSNGARHLLRVRYYRSVVNPDVVAAALVAFKQAHVFLWFEDITGSGGVIIYG